MTEDQAYRVMDAIAEYHRALHAQTDRMAEMEPIKPMDEAEDMLLESLMGGES